MKEQLSIRMDKWIDTRLAKLKNENKKVSTDQILVELIHFFKIDITERNERAMKTRVNRIRNRIDKRHERKLKFYQKMAKDLVVPPSLIDRWICKAWIVPGAKVQNEKLVNLTRELEYYHNFKPEIPEDIEMPIWRI